MTRSKSRILSLAGRKPSPSQLVAGVALAGSLVLSGCGDSEVGAAGVGGSGAPPRSHLLVVTERESPEVSMQYLHVLADWPADGKLDYRAAVELGEFVNVQAFDDAVYVHQPEDASIRKLLVTPDGTVTETARLLLSAYGVSGFSGDMIYVSPERAYFLDETAGVLLSWNPATMSIVSSSAIAEDALSRQGLPAQISRGIALGGEGFVAASYRDWETYAYYDAAAIGVFDASESSPELRIIEDERCASTVTTPFDGGDGYVYLFSDAALGFDALANPTRTEKALCVLRMRPGAGEFDPEFFLDLRQALASPGFYAAHPMKGGKLLVNVWAPDVDAEGVADPEDPMWYWDAPPYFEYAIVDLESGSAVPVPDITRAAVQWSITLRADGETYVQTYRDDQGSDLRHVDPDGRVTVVISNDAGTDIQYIGRVQNSAD